jgi:hypothetical protein
MICVGCEHLLHSRTAATVLIALLLDQLFTLHTHRHTAVPGTLLLVSTAVAV